MAKDKFLDRMRLAHCIGLLDYGYATLRLDCARVEGVGAQSPHALHPGAIQGKEGVKFCYLETLLSEASVTHLPLPAIVVEAQNVCALLRAAGDAPDEKEGAVPRLHDGGLVDLAR